MSKRREHENSTKYESKKCMPLILESMPEGNYRFVSELPTSQSKEGSTISSRFIISVS